jgi:hypothetical protein
LFDAAYVCVGKALVALYANTPFGPATPLASACNGPRSTPWPAKKPELIGKRPFGQWYDAT